MMTKLRPRDIFFNDPYFDFATHCKTADLRLAKRVEIWDKWYRTQGLVNTLLQRESLAFIRYNGTEREEAMILRIYERTPDRLLINTYYTSKRNATEIYAGTIRLERYATAQTTGDDSYMGMIDLLMLKTDDELVGLSDVFEDIQQAKHMAAQSLGIYLMAIYDGPWVDDSRADAEKTPAMIAGEEREELLQLRQEKAQMEADREELLKLRLESQNRKTVLSELERLRQELEDERNGRQEDLQHYEATLRQQEEYTERIKEKAAIQVSELLTLRQTLRKYEANPELAKKVVSSPERTSSAAVPKADAAVNPSAPITASTPVKSDAPAPSKAADPTASTAPVRATETKKAASPEKPTAPTQPSVSETSPAPAASGDGSTSAEPMKTAERTATEKPGETAGPATAPQTTDTSAATQKKAKRPSEDRGLELPSFMTQRDYTHSLDRFLAGRQIALAGGTPEWQGRIKRRFPTAAVLSGYTGDDRILRASTLLVINLSEGQTDLVKWAMAAARDMGCPCLPIKTTNLNGFAKAVVEYAKKV